MAEHKRPVKVTPAAVLLAIRENPSSTMESLCGLFHIPFESSSTRWFREIRDLEVTLRALLAAGVLEQEHEGKYKPTQQWFAFQKCLQFSLTELAVRSDATAADAWREVSDLARLARQHPVCGDYADDFVRTLEEIGRAYVAECYIAVISLCGKILEVCLKEMLRKHNVPYEEQWMIGKLLSVATEFVPSYYADPALKNVCNIVNNARIPAVHAKIKVPVPSQNQADMVIHAMADVARRLLVS